MGDAGAASLKSFPLNGRFPGLDGTARPCPVGDAAKAIPESLLGLRFPEKVPYPVADGYVRNLEVTILKLFEKCWVSNPRYDPLSPGHVVLDGVGMSSEAFRDATVLNAIVHCAAMIFRLHGASISINCYKAGK